MKALIPLAFVGWVLICAWLTVKARDWGYRVTLRWVMRHKGKS